MDDWIDVTRPELYLSRSNVYNMLEDSHEDDLEVVPVDEVFDFGHQEVRV